MHVGDQLLAVDNVSLLGLAQIEVRISMARFLLSFVLLQNLMVVSVPCFSFIVHAIYFINHLLLYLLLFFFKFIILFLSNAFDNYLNF